MVVDEFVNSFSRVAIAGYYGSARVALFVDLWKYVKTTGLGFRVGRAGKEPLLAGNPCVSGQCIP